MDPADYKEICARPDVVQRPVIEETVRVLPAWCTGFTDSRFVRGLGTPTFGFQLVEPSADAERLSIHCIDESIEAGMLLPCSLALAHLALDFCYGEDIGRKEEPSESVAASD